MGFSNVPTKNTGDSWTAAEHNTYLRDNMEAVRGKIALLRRDSGTQTIANDTETALTYTVVTFDTDGFANLGSFPTRLTMPVSGQYLMGGGTRFFINATGYRETIPFLNGGSLRGRTTVVNAGSNVATQIFCVAPFNAIANDYIEVLVRQNSGGDLGVDGSFMWVANMRET